MVVLQGNGLEQLPESVGQLGLLKVLDVSMNKLSSLPNLSGRRGDGYLEYRYQLIGSL